MYAVSGEREEGAEGKKEQKQTAVTERRQSQKKHAREKNGRLQIGEVLFRADTGVSISRPINALIRLLPPSLSSAG